MVSPTTEAISLLPLALIPATVVPLAGRLDTEKGACGRVAPGMVRALAPLLDSTALSDWVPAPRAALPKSIVSGLKSGWPVAYSPVRASTPSPAANPIGPSGAM